ncbi:hypothetical protein [Nonomuraea aurantiaca]|uniref:hypothetical protein n=1 Tax=Nonomuraea aurantiaca TaxID=2878562 RepID=UPI001CD98BDC|nr:hypothetical protein [Nonomuraea aurantiaca]MCA2230365.1 hypothetical protein [Nonomuraea aurantiaca]
MRDDQAAVSLETVRTLVDEQFPQWKDLPLASVAHGGTVNAIMRVGDRLTDRFPLQPGDAGSLRRGLESEARPPREPTAALRLLLPGRA